MKIFYKTFIVGILSLFLAQQLTAQNEIDAISMGKAYTSLNTTNVFSVWNNQASMAYLLKPSFGLAYKNSYLIKELGTTAFAAALPTKYGNFGFSTKYFGFSQYNQLSLGIAYALKLSDKFAAGIKLNYQHLQFSSYYGATGVFFGEIGIISRPIKNLSIAAHIYNPTFSKFNSELPLSTIEQVGISYQFSDNLNLNIEQKSNFNYNQLRIGGEYQLLNFLVLRTGISTNPLLADFGIGFNFSTFSCNIAMQYNNYSLISSNSFNTAIDLIYNL